MSRSGRSSSSSSSGSSHSSSVHNEQELGNSAVNVFKNDGSFLEMFKKIQEAKDNEPHKKTDIVISSSTSAAAAPVKLEETPKAKALPMVGKRRGGRALPTGLVKKAKKGATVGEDEEVEAPKDAWSQYMAEVKRYKETSCEEEGKTRPLVK